ncbi:MAG: class I SAM-dependent rRNA methyltransferase [Bradymonadia bacterium]
MSAGAKSSGPLKPPVIRLTKKGLRRLRSGHPWIFQSDIADVPDSTVGGDLVKVAGPDGRALAVAAYSATSLITLRCIPLTLKEDFEAGWMRLIDAAIQRRGGGRQGQRLVNGDADGLPGLIVDQYDDAISIQALSQAADRRLDPLVEHLKASLGPTLLVARNDPRVRTLEGLPQEKKILYSAEGRAESTRSLVQLGEVKMEIDLFEGQKTGAFLDQVGNWVRAGEIAQHMLAEQGEGATLKALDCCCYNGGFSLHLAQAGAEVTAIDASAVALERVRANAETNGLSDRVTPLEANVFDQLRAYEAEGTTFDLIVLDPPAFAKRKSALKSGQRAYKEINLRALKLLRPGGRLITCSCSAQMTRPRFEEMLREAAADARRWVRILERRGAGPDHPTLITAPETDYLKVLVAEA